MSIHQKAVEGTENTSSMDLMINISGTGKLGITAKLDLSEIGRMREIIAHCQAILQIIANVPAPVNYELEAHWQKLDAHYRGKT